jgi:hypothetical protein
MKNLDCNIQNGNFNGAKKNHCKRLSKKLKARRNVFSTSMTSKAHSFEIHYEIVATMEQQKDFSLLIFLSFSSHRLCNQK